jgi:hypothetical protein
VVDKLNALFPQSTCAELSSLCLVTQLGRLVGRRSRYLSTCRGPRTDGKPAAAAAAADMASSADQPAAGSQEADADKVELDAAAAYIVDVLDQLLLMRGSGAALTEAQLDEWCLAAAALPDGALTALLPDIPPMRELLQMLSDAPADELETMKSAILAHGEQGKADRSSAGKGMTLRSPPVVNVSEGPEARLGSGAAGHACWICYDDESTGDLVHCGCGCRGTEGYAHVACVAKGAEAQPLREDGGAKMWLECPTCDCIQ